MLRERKLVERGHMRTCFIITLAEKCPVVIYVNFYWGWLEPTFAKQKIVFLLRTYVYLWMVGEGDKEDLREVKISPSDHPSASALNFSHSNNIVTIDSQGAPGELPHWPRRRRGRFLCWVHPKLDRWMDRAWMHQKQARWMDRNKTFPSLLP